MRVKPSTEKTKDGDGTGFGGSAEALEAGIEGEDIGVNADLILVEHLHRVEIDNSGPVIGLTSQESEMCSGIEGYAV